LSVDLIASVSATQIFKEKLINLPRYGCINVHTAKLPKYRGLYPTYWAMVSGEETVGISVHYIEKGIDTGGIILQGEVEIPADATLDHMLRVTKVRGAELLIKVIKQIVEGTVQAFYPSKVVLTVPVVRILDKQSKQYSFQSTIWGMFSGTRFAKTLN
jgi:methionyl-tRNA formyltransferase